MNVEAAKKEFMGFEYKEFMVKRNMLDVFMDSIESFGWTIEGLEEALGRVDSLVMRAKRNRKIVNKAELTRLQKQFEACASEISSLEHSKVIKASAIAYIVGLIGTAFMTGSVFAVAADKIALCVVLAIPAFIGWIIPYWLFKGIKGKRTEQVNPIIEQKYDELYAVCEKANALLN